MSETSDYYHHHGVRVSVTLVAVCDRVRAVALSLFFCSTQSVRGYILLIFYKEEEEEEQATVSTAADQKTWW